MIADQYINEGIRIRKTYMLNIKEILKQQSSIFEKKTAFDTLKLEMENIVKSDLNDIRKSLELDNKMMKIEKELIYIQDIIRPYANTIEQLRLDSDKLYLAIKERYPNITNDQIENEILSRTE